MDSPFPKLCPAVTLSHQDGRHSTVALLFKAALIQMSDYRLLGASGFFWPLCCMSFDLRPLVHSDFSKNTIKDINLYLIMTMKSCIDFDAISISNWNYIEYNDYKYSTNAEHPCQRCFFQRWTMRIPTYQHSNTKLISEELTGSTTGATSGAGTAYLSGAPEFTPSLYCSIFRFLCRVF